MVTRRGMLLLMLALLSSYTALKSGKPDPIKRLSTTEKTGKRCEVHGNELQLDIIPIFRGSMGFPEGYWEARPCLFPHLALIEFVGAAPIAHDKTEVMYCPACREAYKTWLARKETI